MSEVQTVSFDPRYRDWVLEGSKTSTTRYDDPVSVGPARFRFESDPPTYLDAEVTHLRTVRVDQLTDDDAASENFATADELRAALRYHYPGIADEAAVTIVSFAVPTPDQPLRTELESMSLPETS